MTEEMVTAVQDFMHAAVSALRELDEACTYGLPSYSSSRMERLIDEASEAVSKFEIARMEADA